MNQRTINKEASLTGVGLHSGIETTIILKPAQANEGVVFVRTDLVNSPSVKACPESIPEESVSRCTLIQEGDARVLTIEHLMSALAGLSIDNLIVEINGEEVPGMDGSAQDFLNAIQEAGIKELDQKRDVFVVSEPIFVEHEGASLMVVPSDIFQIFYMLDYPVKPLHSQFVHFRVNEETYVKDIAPARTFCLESESRQLLDAGFGKGANSQNTLIVSDKGPVDNKFRFEDECARHKLLDCMGDLFLLGRPIQGKVYGVKSGHALNLRMVKKIARLCKAVASSKAAAISVQNGKELNIEEIMKVLPHRYPFLLVDRILDIEIGKKAVGVKNVTMNDGFFRGHFPGKPVMPGVLMVEAMAQVGGVAMLTSPAHHGKLALFMAVDKVKFRRQVVPGDQLVMETEILRERSKTAQIRGIAKVNNEVVCEADMMFSVVSGDFLHE